MAETAIIINQSDLRMFLAEERESLHKELASVQQALIKEAVALAVTELYELLGPMLPANANLEFIARAEGLGRNVVYQEAGRPYLPDFGRKKAGRGRKLVWPMSEYLAWRSRPIEERRAELQRIKKRGNFEESAPRSGKPGRPRGTRKLEI